MYQNSVCTYCAYFAYLLYSAFQTYFAYFADYIFCIFCVFCVFDIFCIFSFCVCVRLKKNGKDAKEISLIGQGFQGYLDHLFWYLPFSTAKQAHDMLAKREMSDEPWIKKRDEIKAEHLLD